MTNYSYTHTDLSERGYVSVPVNSKGVPLESGFLERNEPYPLEVIEDWCNKYPDASVALVCGKSDIYALDFDIDDFDVANQLITAMGDKGWCIRRTVGHGSSRFAVVFKADKSLTTVSNASSAIYMVDGEKNQIELIANRILTIDGIHRKTGSIYHWDYPMWLEHIDDHPTLTYKDVERLFETFTELMVSKGYKAKRENSSWSFRATETKDVFALIKPTRNYSDEEVDEMLQYVQGDERDEWLKVGMALHAHYNGDTRGFRKWDEWSSQYDGYSGTDDCRYAWKRFNSEKGVTMGTVAHKAKAKMNTGIKPEQSDQSPLDFALENYVLIAGTNEVGDLSKRVNESILPLQNMKNLKSNIKVPVKTANNKGEVTIKYKPLMTAWIEHEDRLHAQSVEYVPCDKRMLDGAEFDGGYRGEPYYNKYVPPTVEYTDDDYLVKYFTDHIEYMFASEPKWVINWLAQTVQTPQQRYRTILYSIATHTGTGRGWLVKLLHSLYGVDNVSTIPSLATVADASAKTGYLDGSVLLVVNETDAPGKARYDVGDRLKTIVSDDRQPIDIKFGKQTFNQQIYCRVFMQSNSIGNLVIEQNDNRIQPFINLNPPKSKQYYTRLYNLLKNKDFINQVYSYLMRWKVDISMLQASHMTEEKRIVIEANTSATAKMFYEFMTVVSDGCFTRQQLNHALSKRLAVNEFSDEETLNHKELHHLMREHVTLNQQVNINGVTTVVYAIETNDKLSWGASQFAKDIQQTNQLISEHYGD